MGGGGWGWSVSGCGVGEESSLPGDGREESSVAGPEVQWGEALLPMSGFSQEGSEELEEGRRWRAAPMQNVQRQ